MYDGLLRRVRQATYDTWRAEAAVHPGGEIAEIDGLLCHTTGIPVLQWNGVHVMRVPDDPVRALRASMDWFAQRGLGYAVLIPVEEVPALAPACGEVGLQLIKVQPQMVLPAADFAPVAVPSELAVRPVGPGDVDAVVTLAQECFGNPPAEMRRFVTPYVQGPDWTMLLGFVDGAPVATATAMRVPGAVGVYGVATTAGHRRRGYGAALTSVALASSFAAQATAIAHLNPSELAEGVYLRLGFRSLPGWAIWSAPMPTPPA